MALINTVTIAFIAEPPYLTPWNCPIGLTLQTGQVFIWPRLSCLASLSAVYYEYISLCSQYDIKDLLSSRMYIRESVWNAFCNRAF